MYDPLGRRIEKTTGGVTTRWTYAGEDILREVRGGTTIKYVHGPGIDEPLAAVEGSTVTYFHADALGSIAKMTSAEGSVDLSRRYDAWGNLELAATSGGYTFTGREWDAETGLYYYRARYYDPKIGRFVSEDPIGFLGGNNFYAYVENNPVNWSDPTGLASARAECMLATTLAGAATGSTIGAAAGGTTVGLASGGTLTLPGGGAGMAAGGLIGGGAGLITGLFMCPPPDSCSDKEDRKSQCLAQYYKDTAWCGQVYTDDRIYNKCMDHAWANYLRCLNNVPPKPFTP